MNDKEQRIADLKVNIEDIDLRIDILKDELYTLKEEYKELTGEEFEY